MKPISTSWRITVVVLALLILAVIPAAAQDTNVYIPFVGTVPSVEPAAVEQAAEQPAEEAQPAAAPDAIPAILRHEPGHPPKVNDLDVRLAAGEISDPLAGTTTLISWDKVALVYHAENNMFMHKTFDVAATLAAPVPKEDIDVSLVGGGGNMDVAAGNLLGGNPGPFRDSVAVYENSSGKITVYLEAYHSGLGKADDGILSSADVVEGNNAGWPTTGGEICVATGDFDGDGYDEFVVVWEGASASLNLRVYETDDKLNPIYQVTSDLHTLTKKGTAAPLAGNGLNATVELAGRQLGVRAGDFNADGVKELALIYGASEKSYCNVSVYSADTALALTARGALLSTWPTCYGDLSMAVGDLNRDVIDEIIVSSRFGKEVLQSNDVDLGIFQVAPDLAVITQQGYIEDTELVASGFAHAAVAVGAYDGKSVRVGPPTYSHKDNTLQLLAVINAPPKHKDTVNGVVYDVNVTNRCRLPPCIYARYETVEKTSTSMAVTTNRDWSVSSELKLHYAFVSASMTASYGESFEKTTTSFKSQEFGQDVDADEDDAIVRLVQSLNIWEYPVYADGTDVVQGQILVVWPDKVDPTCTSNCAAAITARTDGKNPTSYYQPNHEVFDVLSYSPMAPTDISTTIKSDVKNDLGSNGYQMWIKWADVQDSETKQSNKLDLGASLEVSAWAKVSPSPATTVRGRPRSTRSVSSKAPKSTCISTASSRSIRTGCGRSSTGPNRMAIWCWTTR